MDAEDNPQATPSWFVTYSDLMSLLLTFFVMMVSFSELKSEEKYQALMDGFEQQFGGYQGRAEVAPGELRPRNAQLSRLVTSNQNLRRTAVSGLTQALADSGDAKYHPAINPEPLRSVGTVLYFQEDQIELDDTQRLLLERHADGLRGTTQKVEIRGHTSNRPPPSETQVRDNWDLCFERCRRVMQYLVDEQQVDSRTLRISATAANEPLVPTTSKRELQRESRVELLLLDEPINDINGR